MEHDVVPLNSYLTYANESEIKHFMSTFSCPVNNDIEIFLKEKSIKFEQKIFSRTYLIIHNTYTEQLLLGYFTLALKVLNLDSSVSNKLKKIVSGYSNKKETTVYLIGQIGKNFNINHNQINGYDLMCYALEAIINASNIVGGRAIAIECKDIDSLTQFYKKFGFELLTNTQYNELQTYVLNIDKLN